MASEAKQYAQRNRQGSDWFTHDKSDSSTTPSAPTTTSPVPTAEVANGDGAVAGERAQMIKPKCDSNQWYKYDGADEVAKSAPVTEGGAYCRRDKAGSASEWFSHDHSDGSGGTDVSRSNALQTEGSANAARMRNESDAWYSHDKAGEQAHGPTSARGRVDRPVNTEMHGIFHHAGADK